MRGMIARSAGVGFVLASVSVTLIAGPAKKSVKPANSGTPVVTDWSHRHLIFSHPTTPEQAARVQQDVRYRMQQDRAKSRTILETSVQGKRKFGPHHRRGLRMHRDWKVDLGPGAAVPAGKYPAKYNFSSIVAYCFGDPTVQADFVVFGTGVPGSASQGSIIAVTNLYNGCPNDPKPAAYFSYNTGGAVNTSPVLSIDGLQLAFTQVSGGTSSLVLLKWSPFDGPDVQTPVTPNIALPSDYLGCTAPCMTSFTLGANDTNSSVYYDYGADTAYVGDDAGKLHQFSGVFSGTPAEVTGGWPVAISANKLTGAVHEPASNNTFVGDSGGFLYRVDAAGAKTTSGRLDFGTGLAEGPIIDSTIATAYVFSSKDAGGSAAVIQMNTGFGAGTTGTEVTIGTGATAPTIQYNGAFDNGYIFSPDSTGNLWVCGNPGSNPTLYQIPILAGVMGAAKVGPPLSTTTQTTCSPVTDVYNTILQGAGLPQEWTFMSVQAAGAPTPCATHSCVMSFKVTPWQPNTTYNVGQEVLDSNFNVQIEELPNAVSGGPAPPPWSTTVFGTTIDGGAHWRNQGPLTTQTPPGWSANNVYAGAFEIIDSNNNIEIAELGGGTSGATQPAWSLIEGTEIVDGGVTWYNIGANPVAALQAPGGTSGIIIDNTTNTPGGSQVYYSTLDGGCGGDGTHGCGVQASQQGLN